MPIPAMIWRLKSISVDEWPHLNTEAELSTFSVDNSVYKLKIKRLTIHF